MKSTLPFFKQTLFRSIFMLLVLTTIFSCEKEDLVEEVNPKKFSEFTIESHQSINYEFDERILKKLLEVKSQMFTRQKSFYDSINHFYIDDSRFSHLEVGDYESFAFKIVDTQDTLYNKQLILATKLNEQNEIYYESYLAKIPQFNIATNAKSGDIITNKVQIAKLETIFSLNKELAYFATGDCLSVYEAHEVDVCGDILDDRPRCGSYEGTFGTSSYHWVPNTRMEYTLLSTSCGSSGGDGSTDGANDTSGNYDGGSYDGSPSRGGYLNPDGETPFSTVNNCPDGSLSDGSGGCINPDQYNREELMLKEFYYTVGSAFLTWINDPQNVDFKLQVESFLKSNMRDLTSFAFARAAIEAKSLNARFTEVDFENKSINDPSVPECLKDVIDKFKPTEGFNVDFNGLQTQLATQLSMPNLILDLFDNNQNYGLKFVVDNIPNNSRNEPVNANTIPTDSPDGGRMVTVTLNSDYVNRATDLALARTVIHELMHAYFIYELETNPNGTIGTAIDEIIEDAGVTLLTPEHELMARQFVTIMANSLEQWNGSVQDRTEYERLAWSGGMKDSDIFKDMDPNEQFFINFRDQIESDPTDPDNFALADPLGIKNC